MKPSAALLIDLENFYLSRIDHFNGEGIRIEDRPSFAEDLRNLVRYAHGITQMPFAVRRAYADFDALKVNPQELMRQGVEPVQVFRLSGKTANKNAADMKLAMDAVSLNSAGGPVEHFVLVSGDADFIPVILELKRRGHTVSVIAVTGATNEFIQRFVDHFELFESRQSLEAARPRERVALPAVAADLPAVAAALRRLLTRMRPIRFNLVQPRLSKELGYLFEPTAFGCENTGEFLRKNHTALGIALRGTSNEQEIDLPGAMAPSANGAKAAPRTADRAPKPPAPPAPEPHTAAHYRLLLASGRPDANEARVLVVPWSALVWVCDAVVPALAPPTGSPATSIELLPRIQAAARTTSIPDLDRYAAQIHAAVRCSLPVPSPDGVYSLTPDATGEQIRRKLLRYTMYVLGRRLAENGVSGPIRPDAVVEMFEPGDATEAATAEIQAALASDEEPVLAAPAPAKPAAPASELHTPSAYRRLLQNGGPKDSGETEHMRIQPAPWPSVERVCADTFTLLSPDAGGGPMPRGLLMGKLYEAGKPLRIEKYDTHVRRAVGLLTLSNAILEDGGRLALHPEVGDAGDIRWAALGMALRLLAVRLEEKGVSEPIRAEAFVAAIEAGPLTDQMIPEIAHAIGGMYQSVAAPATTESAAAADVIEEHEVEVVEEDDPAPVTDVEVVSEAEEPEPEPVRDMPGYRPEPVTAAEPTDWDPFAFDAELPETPPPAPTGPKRDYASSAESSKSGIIDVGAITSAAVASADSQLPTSEAPTAKLGPPDPEPLVFAPEVASSRPPAPGTKPPPADEPPVALRVGDWSSDEDSIFSDPDLGIEKITERLTGSSTRLAPRLPAPVPPVDDDDALFTDPDGGLERITERLTGSSARLAPRMPADPISRVARIKPQPPPKFPPESA